MKISLKYYTTKYLIGILLLIIAIWAALFYAYILDEVYDNVDDGLKDRKIQIIKAIYLDKNLLNSKEFGFNEFKITPISPEEYKDKNRLYNKMFYMEYDDKEQPYRVLETDFVDQFGKYQKLEIRTSTVEQDELIYDFTTALIVLYVLLVISIIGMNGFLLNKAMRPFYSILDKLKKYQFGISTVTETPNYSIKEFEELDTEVNEMIERNEQVFYQQKQFIENASHELQTPLAIVSNKIDLMIQNEELDEKNLRFLSDIKNDLGRMTGFNKSLLMLSKIENNQFNKNILVDFNILIKDLVESYEDFIEFKKTQVNIFEKENFVADFDPDLARILLSNLLKNAIKYNDDQKLVHILIEKNRIIFQNTGAKHSLDQSKVFNRFYKQDTDHSSTGLGLSINKTIIKQYPDWDIAYRFDEGMHCFIITK
ncbi:sensor histidine kinase [Chryseobacterium oryctis]|uniref:histidine kinase n=1 Tax=Chryseobacterium oryctis TaxID=2952618 RepID=A0ABT3HMG0_9FLAO|nr:HAMP domain-containing sensor histidine kinase [Chryseobacterium oryctis]MCW3160966.1 HAMP domain-containing histidine kinase [Chryseobacterium oryctis]